MLLTDIFNFNAKHIKILQNTANPVSLKMWIFLGFTDGIEIWNLFYNLTGSKR